MKAASRQLSGDFASGGQGLAPLHPLFAPSARAFRSATFCRESGELTILIPFGNGYPPSEKPSEFPKRLLGHARLTTTDNYIKSLMPDMRNWDDVLDSILDEKPSVSEQKDAQNDSLNKKRVTSFNVTLRFLAEKEGFEPSYELYTHNTLSRRAPSANSATSPLLMRP